MQHTPDTSWFVNENSIVRRVWGNADVILFIFAGAAAEFALNKAVDWLYYTGKLPADPLGRLFSTVGYARGIVFSPTEVANTTIDKIRNIHGAVESARGALIPDWAYRDVLFMLIHYSIAAYELFEPKMQDSEKAEVYDVFYRVGLRMGLKELPTTYATWLPARAAHLAANLQQSRYTVDLFRQYKKHLGALRFRILLEGQKMVVPDDVKKLLDFSKFSLLTPLMPAYRIVKLMKMDGALKNLLLPAAYKAEIQALNIYPAQAKHS